MYKAVIVPYGAYQRVILIAYYIQGHDFLNTPCIEVELRLFIPYVVTGEYAVAGIYHDVTAVSAVHCKDGAPVYGIYAYPVHAVGGHGVLAGKLLPCSAPVCGTEEHVTVGAIGLLLPAFTGDKKDIVIVGGVYHDIPYGSLFNRHFISLAAVGVIAVQTACHAVPGTLIVAIAHIEPPLGIKVKALGHILLHIVGRNIGLP